MTIEFLYGRRESLTGKSEAYKRSVRAYLESFGFSQTTDSIVEGTFEDMVFYNPTVAPGRRFVVEAKAEILSLKSKKLARELVKYFRLWHAQEHSKRFKFLLFTQGVKRPNLWESIFSETNNISKVKDWCSWYNDKCLETSEHSLETTDIVDMAKFFSESTVKVGDKLALELAVSEKESTSALSISRMARNLLKIVNKRRAPIMKKSSLIMDIIPIGVPDYYYVCSSTANSKQEIYGGLKGELIPPFIWRKDKSMMSFARFDQDNSLSQYVKGSVIMMNTKQLQKENPPMSSNLVNIHLRRMIWNKGVYRDPGAEIFYFPMLDKSKDKRLELGPKRRKRWVVKKITHRKDTKFARKGETNFFFHRAVELRTPTYWEVSYIELIPKKYYTLDGETPIDGTIRAKIDAKFRKPSYDRSKNRIAVMKFWKFVLFDSKSYVIPPEKWFDTFRFGDLMTEQVSWSPKVIGRDQTRLWDFVGDA
jgi:hypothetical protein